MPETGRAAFGRRLRWVFQPTPAQSPAAGHLCSSPAAARKAGGNGTCCRRGFKHIYTAPCFPRIP